MKYLAALFIVACQPPTPAQEVSILKAELVVASTKCAVYTVDQKFPRDVKVTEKCDKLIKP